MEVKNSECNQALQTLIYVHQDVHNIHQQLIAMEEAINKLTYRLNSIQLTLSSLEKQIKGDEK